MTTYASLHNHSTFSLQDGLNSAKEWVDAAIRKGLAGIGITNHGSGGDLIEFYREGKKKKFPVVLGTEFYFAIDREHRDNHNRYYHLNLWAKNEVGYKNLCILNTLSWNKDRFYFKPRIDLADLQQYKEGLVCGSACAAGLIAKHIDTKNVCMTKEAEAGFQMLLALFGDDFYVELIPADISWKWQAPAEFEKEGHFNKEFDINPQEIINRILITMADDYGVKIIATPDAHMIDPEYKIVQDIQIINAQRARGDGWHFKETYYLPTYEEFLDIWKAEHPYVFKDNRIYEFLENTLEIVDKCKFDLNFKPLLPVVTEQASSDFLKKMIAEKAIVDLNSKKIRDRLDYELEVLCNNGKIDLTNYFLLLEDLVQYCRQNNIVVGPGRGSACGSLLCYALGITLVDPLKYDLSFSRFINEARIQENTLPDIDLDFSNPAAAKKYLYDKYGADHVASIGTIQTLQLRMALKDTLRVLEKDLSSEDANKLTKRISDNVDGDDNKTYFLKQIDKNPDLKALILKNKKIYHACLNLIGQARQRGIHAAAVVVSPIPLKEVLPLALDDAGWVTQYTMSDVEYVGLIKYDILGLNTLNDINNCLQLVERNHGLKLTVTDIINEHDRDEQVFKAFEKGDTYSVFQFNTDVARSILMKIPIESIDDLAVVTALGRPGTLDVGMEKVYIEVANNRRPLEYVHSSVEKVLAPTKGIMLYQEQVMELFKVLGGFNDVDADNIRRGMAKKKAEVLADYEQRFLDAVPKIHPDISIEKAKKIWKLIEANSGYSFNRSHAIAYALIGYICQYLKVYYPLEWWCAVLMNETSGQILSEIVKNLGDKFMPPDINHSKETFYIDLELGKIVAPFSFIMNVGPKAVEMLVRGRPYTNFEDLIKRCDRRVVRKDAIVNLILSGAFSTIEQGTEIELIERYYRTLADLTAKNQNDARKILQEFKDKYQHMTRAELIQLRNAATPGSAQNYFDIFKDLLPKDVRRYDYVKKLPDGIAVLTAGIVSKIKTLFTKKGEEMAFITLSDGMEELSLTLFPQQYNMYGANLFEDPNRIIIVKGKTNLWNDKMSVVVNSLEIRDI